VQDERKKNQGTGLSTISVRWAHQQRASELTKAMNCSYLDIMKIDPSHDVMTAALAEAAAIVAIVPSAPDRDQPGAAIKRGMYAGLVTICGGWMVPGDKNISREMRLVLDRRASAAGRRQAAELCAKYRLQPPAEMVKGAEAAFEHTARRILRAGRIEGNHEALVNHLIEIWNLSFAVELRRQRRKRDKGLS
jgi:hypothetical protein